MSYVSAINEHIASKFTPVVHRNKWLIHKSQMTSKGQGQTCREPYKSHFEPEVVEISSSLQNVSYSMEHSVRCLPLTYDVTLLRHMT